MNTVLRNQAKNNYTQITDQNQSKRANRQQSPIVCLSSNVFFTINRQRYENEWDEKFREEKKPSVVRQVNFVSSYGTVHSMSTVLYMRCVQYCTCDAYSTVHPMRTALYTRCVQHCTPDAHSREGFSPVLSYSGHDSSTSQVSATQTNPI